MGCEWPARGGNTPIINESWYNVHGWMGAPAIGRDLLEEVAHGCDGLSCAPPKGDRRIRVLADSHAEPWRFNTIRALPCGSNV